jgi:rhodanese-related sulfurtransferase
MPPALTRRALLFGLGGAAAIGLGAASTLGRDRFEGEVIAPPALLDAVRQGDLLLVDIRRPDDWERTGIAQGASPIDMRRDDFMDALHTLTGGGRDRPIALICARGVRSDRLSARLDAAGYTRIVDVPEGMLGSSAGPGWIARGLPLVRP